MMCEKKFDPAKPVQTRDGRPARIICTDLKDPSGTLSIVALIDEGKFERMFPFTAEGRVAAHLNHDMELVNVPEKHVGWVNVYRRRGELSAGPVISETKASADALAAGGSRVACLRVEFQEGEGL